MSQWETMASHEWKHHIPDSIFALKEVGEDVGELEEMRREGQQYFDVSDFGMVWRQIARIRHLMRQKRGGIPLLSGFMDETQFLKGIEEGEEPERPTTWAGLVKVVPGWPAHEVMATDEPLQAVDTDGSYGDRTWAGWLGKIIGGALGTPVEGWSSEQIAREYGELTGYLRPPDSFNDDTMFQLTFISAMERAGGDATSEELGLEWVQRIPVACTAEDFAIRNMRRGILPPLSAWVNNPYGEWIGAQMRGEVCGFVAPNDPKRAATLAWRDALVSHIREGLYGEVFNAVLTSLAYGHKGDFADLAQKGLQYVPPGSLFARAVTETLEACHGSDQWKTAWDRIRPRWVEPYHWVHTLANIPAVIIGLWFGWGDFGRAIAITTQCGLDTDCTAGQAGAIMGVLLGSDGIPSKWTDPIGDVMESWVVGMEKLPISELVERTCNLGRRG